MEDKPSSPSESSASRPRGRPKKVAEVEVFKPEVVAEIGSLMPVKLKEKRKRKDSNSEMSTADAPATTSSVESETVVNVDETLKSIVANLPSEGIKSSSAFFNLTSAAAAAAEQPTIQVPAPVIAPNPLVSRGYTGRGRPKGSGRSSTWIPPTERLMASGGSDAASLESEAESVFMLLPMPVMQVAGKRTAQASVEAGEGSLADYAAPMVDVTATVAPPPVKVARGRPKGVSGSSTWITPSLRNVDESNQPH